MLLAAYGIHWLNGQQGASWLHGLKVVAVAVVAQAVWSMAGRSCAERLAGQRHLPGRIRHRSGVARSSVFFCRLSRGRQERLSQRLFSRIMVSFRDSSDTDSSGHWRAPSLESTSGFRGGSVVAGWGQYDSRWNFVGSALSAYLDKCNRFGEELGSRPHPVCRFTNWKIAPWILPQSVLKNWSQKSAWQFRGRRNHFGPCKLSPADLLHSLKLQIARTFSVLCQVYKSILMVLLSISKFAHEAC
jgi:hypothetical protein